MTFPPQLPCRHPPPARPPTHTHSRIPFHLSLRVLVAIHHPTNPTLKREQRNLAPSLQTSTPRAVHPSKSFHHPPIPYHHQLRAKCDSIERVQSCQTAGKKPICTHERCWQERQGTPQKGYPGGAGGNFCTSGCQTGGSKSR